MTNSPTPEHKELKSSDTKLETNEKNTELKLSKNADNLRKKPFQANLAKFFVNFLYLIVGSLISGIAVNVLYIPIKLTMGGLSGVASIIFQLTGKGAFLSFGTLVVLLNIPLLLLGWWKIGLRFVWKSIVGTFVYSFALDFTASFSSNWWKEYLDQPLASGHADPLIFCIFGGILFGLSMGLILKGGYTTGGTDILAVVIHRRFNNISMGKILMATDVIVVTASLFFYRSSSSALLLVMFSFIAMFFTASFTDIGLDGFNHSRVAYIISDEHKLIAKHLMEELDRGATLLKAKGMYSGKNKNVLFCVLSNRQIPRLKGIVKSLDPSAFVVVSDAREVLGEGFRGHSGELFNE